MSKKSRLLDIYYGSDSSAGLDGEGADEVLDTVYGNPELPEEQAQEESPYDSIRLLARERVEQANLYTALLDANFFSEDSARPEILTKVESEIKSFVSERLAVFVGLKVEAQAEQPVEQLFSEEQIGALKSLADRLLVRTPNLAKKEEPSEDLPVAKVNRISIAKPKANIRSPKQSERPKEKAAKRHKATASSKKESVEVVPEHLNQEIERPPSSEYDKNVFIPSRRRKKPLSPQQQAMLLAMQQEQLSESGSSMVLSEATVTSDKL